LTYNYSLDTTISRLPSIVGHNPCITVIAVGPPYRQTRLTHTIDLNPQKMYHELYYYEH